MADEAEIDRIYASTLERCRCAAADVFERLAIAFKVTPALLPEDVGDAQQRGQRS
ncbi:hypothetical protein MACH05_00900 [Qipengyuania nanhaisediminis]